MKKWIFLIIVAFFTQGCQSQYARDHDQLPGVQLGKVCHIDSCDDCDPPTSSCLLSNQDIVGASCSCPTAKGIQYGTVTP